MKENRSLLKLLVLTPLTAGIYGLWFWSKYAADMNVICNGDGKKTHGILFRLMMTVLTLGIYDLVWTYGVGNRIAENCRKQGIPDDTTGGKLVLWNTLGLLLAGIGPFISMYKMIHGINVLSMNYNKGTYTAASSPAGAVNVNIYGAGVPA